MEEKQELKSLEEDLLWEVEINASIAQLTNKLIMPNNIREISSLILEQLSYITKSKYSFVGYFDSDSIEVNYHIRAVDDNDQMHVYDRKIAFDSLRGEMSTILKKDKSLVVNRAKDKNGFLMVLLAPCTVQRYILAPASVGKINVGNIGVVNSSRNYTERELMFVKRLSIFFALAIQRFRMDQVIIETNKNLEGQVERRTKQLSESNKKLKNEFAAKQIIERQLREAKIKAEAANRAKSSFVANMSHELRTPLNHIIGFTDLVLDKDAGDLNETQEEYLNDVQQSSRHLLSLINDILDLSKVEAGKLEFKPSQIDIRELLENSLTMVKEKAFKHKIKLAINLDNIPDTIFADERSLKQVMYNLLSNAVKFTSDKGTVSIVAQMLKPDEESNQTLVDVIGRYIKVSVTDTGIGISPENLNRVFHPFEQIQSSLAKKFPGTGLGLSLTKKLIELHNGRIWAESQGEGQGSAFHFIIPESI